MISVAVNLAWLVPGAVGGTEQYTMRLLASVMKDAPADVAIEVVGSKRLVEAYPWMAQGPFAPVVGPLSNRCFRIAAESTSVNRATREADVVHHFGGRLPARRNPRAVVTIHDLQPLDLPANFSRAKQQYLSWALRRSAEAASLICTPSHWVAQSVVERLAVSPDKVRVVSSTWSNPAQPATAGVGNGAADTAAAVEGVLADRLGSGPVILYPAATYPHKNHLILLEAVERLADRNDEVTLVLTGGRGRAEALVASKLRGMRAPVLRLGWVSPSLLTVLIRRAEALVFPSCYEGFGLPLLEAMHAGTPVIASNRCAIPEVVGDGGVLVGVDDPDRWAEAISGVLADRSLAERLSAAGRRRAEAYAPAVSARSLIGAWRDALGRDE